MNIDDPKWTAFVLHELDPAECAELEAALREAPAAAAELEETRAFTARLRTELQGETSTGLTAAQRAAVVGAGSRSDLPAESRNPLNGAVRAVPEERSQTRPWSRVWLPLAAAASITAFGAVVFFQSMTTQSSRREMMVREPADAGGRLDRDNSPGIDRKPLPSGPAPELEVKQLSNSELAASPVPTTAAASQSAPQPTGGRAKDEKSELVMQLAKPAQAPSLPLQLPSLHEQLRPTDARATRAADSDSVSDNLRASGRTQASRPQQNPSSDVDLAKRAKAIETPPPSPSSLPVSGAVRGRNSLDDAARSRVKLVTAAKAPGSEEADPGLSRIAPGLSWESTEGEKTVTIHRGLEVHRIITGSTEEFDTVVDNAFLTVAENPLSTFSIDVDTASYAIVRRLLNEGRRPPKGAVRIEELMNYFPYKYPQPEGDMPFATSLEVATCPWAPAHRLVRVGIKGREIARNKRPPSNLVFLIDVSGSMQPANKLPLLKESLRLLVDQLGAEDRVAIAVYAGASGTVLDSTNDRGEIRSALSKLEAGGSTNGGSGIKLAYKLAEKSFIKGGTNRVILATDGDFNVGVTNQSELVELIEKKARSGVFLTVLGFGMDNLKDSTLEKLADKGNGNYAYIDTLLEGRKVLVEQMAGTLITIAKDVKIQVEFNPQQASSYRLIGYENRLLRKEDFNDDSKDAGEIGAGHTVTALYEVVPRGAEPPKTAVDGLKYQPLPAAPPQPQTATPTPSETRELLTLKLRYKAPDGEKSELRQFPLTDDGASWEKSSVDYRFAAAVAEFGLLLRDSPHKGNATWDSVLELANEGRADDVAGYRTEFVGLVEKARAVDQ